MQIRSFDMRLALAAAVVLPLVSCQTMGHELLEDAHASYERGDYAGAAELYEEVIAVDSQPATAHFLLASSYDNLYRPSRQGKADNDRLLELAVDHYSTALEWETDAAKRMRTMQYLAAAYLRLAGSYMRNQQFEPAIEALRMRATLEPDNPEAFYTIGTYYWEKAFRDVRLSDEEEGEYILLGMREMDRALALRADYMEALVYKNILLRMQANRSEDIERRAQLIAEANALRNRAEELAGRRR